MKKITIIITAIILSSCGSVKKSSTETEIKKDSTATKETSISENESGKKETTINYKASTFTFEPIDSKIPYFVDGKEYKNVKVINKSESEDKKIIEEYQKQINTLITQITQLKADLRHEQNNKEVDYSKFVDSMFKHALYLVLIILFAMWLYKSLNPIELVKKLFKNKTTLL